MILSTAKIIGYLEWDSLRKSYKLLCEFWKKLQVKKVVRRWVSIESYCKLHSWILTLCTWSNNLRSFWVFKYKEIKSSAAVECFAMERMYSVTKHWKQNAFHEIELNTQFEKSKSSFHAARENCYCVTFINILSCVYYSLKK